MAVSSESSLYFLIILEGRFETGRAEGIGEECKKGAAYACDEVALDLKDICDFGLLHSGSFECFDGGDDRCGLGETV